MQQSEKIWFDGELVPWADATVHVMSHVLHYGSSIFEGIRVYETGDGPQFFRLGCHVKRFFESAKIYRLNLAQDRHTVSEACKDVVRANGLASAYVRPLGFQGATRLGLNPGEDPARLAIIAVEWGTLHGESSLDDGIDVCVSSWARLTPNTLPVMAKAGGHYLNSQLIHSEAERHGYQEGVGLAADGTVSEGAGENIFIVRDGVLITPALTGSLLGGITRDSVLKLAADLGIPSETATIPREMLYTADEVFMTGTAAEITPIRSVDRISVGDGKPGEVTCALQTAFFGLFSAETKDSRGWLEPV